MHPIHETGWAVLRGLLDAETIAHARAPLCDERAAAIEGRLKASGRRQEGRTVLGRCTFVDGQGSLDAHLSDVMRSARMREICESIIGPEAWVLGDSFVVKHPGPHGTFVWHQDAALAREPQRTWLIVWIALDDMDATNGALRVLDYADAPYREVRDLGPDDALDEGASKLVPLSAGDAVLFMQDAFHASGPNETERPRRAWMLAYSPDPIDEILDNHHGQGRFYGP